MLILKLISKALQRAYDVKGIRIWTAINKEAGQSIFHCHLHILPCKNIKDRLIADFPGVYDLKKWIWGNRDFNASKRYHHAEKIRLQLNQIKK